ncbi:hypothetical protein SFRURICE_021494, partial [Spodoptera frugiperda]
MPDPGIEPEIPCPAVAHTTTRRTRHRSSFYGADDDEDEISYRRAFVSAEDLGDFRKNTKYEFDPNDLYKTNRRLYDSHAGMRSPIIGAPRVPSHLPEAEAILPGHTLIRPALGMLKSAVKFPHKDLDNGAGVYGNIDSLGITYGGTGERILYTGFRRNNNDFSLPINFRLHGWCGGWATGCRATGSGFDSRTEQLFNVYDCNGRKYSDTFRLRQAQRRNYRQNDDSDDSEINNRRFNDYPRSKSRRGNWPQTPGEDFRRNGHRHDNVNILRLGSVEIDDSQLDLNHADVKILP